MFFVYTVIIIASIDYRNGVVISRPVTSGSTCKLHLTQQDFRTTYQIKTMHHCRRCCFFLSYFTFQTSKTFRCNYYLIYLYKNVSKSIAMHVFNHKIKTLNKLIYIIYKDGQSITFSNPHITLLYNII